MFANITKSIGVILLFGGFIVSCISGGALNYDNFFAIYVCSFESYNWSIATTGIILSVFSGTACLVLGKYLDFQSA